MKNENIESFTEWILLQHNFKSGSSEHGYPNPVQYKHIWLYFVLTNTRKSFKFQNNGNYALNLHTCKLMCSLGILIEMLIYLMWSLQLQPSPFTFGKVFAHYYDDTQTFITFLLCVYVVVSFFLYIPSLWYSLSLSISIRSHIFDLFSSLFSSFKLINAKP